MGSSINIGGILCLAIVLWSFVATSATDYIVGDTSGWTTGVNYDSWAKGKTFTVGDNLVFNYGGGHTVDEVSQSDYDSCTVGNAITSDSTGATTIALKTAGAHSFICGVVGHCANGMKLSVTVATSGGTTTAPSGTPSTSTTPTTTTTTASPVPPSVNTPSAVPAYSSAGTISPATALSAALVALVALTMS